MLFPLVHLVLHDLRHSHPGLHSLHGLHIILFLLDIPLDRSLLMSKKLELGVGGLGDHIGPNEGDKYVFVKVNFYKSGTEVFFRHLFPFPNSKKRDV